jgi:hypothetical protein
MTPVLQHTKAQVLFKYDTLVDNQRGTAVRRAILPLSAIVHKTQGLGTGRIGLQTVEIMTSRALKTSIVAFTCPHLKTFKKTHHQQQKFRCDATDAADAAEKLVPHPDR